MTSVPSVSGSHEILLIDDHPVMTEGLSFLLHREPDLHVSGVANSIGEAWEFLAASQPEIVVSDLTLPDGNGLDFVKALGQERPGLPVLILSMHDETLYAERALRAGARGYLMKGTSSAAVVPAIRQVLSGGFYFTEEISAKLVSASIGTGANEDSPLARLSDRQLQIFELIGIGKSTSEISKQLGVSTGTVDAHRWEIRRRLNLRDNSELVRYAVSWVES